MTADGVLPRLRYLAQDAPWPSLSGAALRDAGLLRELSRRYRVELLLLTRGPPDAAREAVPAGICAEVTVLPAADSTRRGRLQLLPLMLYAGLPYHSAVTLRSCAAAGWVQRLQQDPVVVVTGSGAWGSLAPPRAGHWILGQTDADIDSWHVYQRTSRAPLQRLAAWANLQLAEHHFPPLYRRVGQILSVCAEDLELTRRYAPQTPIDVILNGVDCRTFQPQPSTAPHNPPQLLFSGTSAERNVSALAAFVQHSWPLVQTAQPDARLCIAGDWQPAAQQRFSGIPGLVFTGRQPDLRPYFAQSDLVIVPFNDSNGSKLKISEALALGMPIVATPAALRGFALRDGEHVAIGRDPAEFAAQCLRLLDDPAAAARLGRAGRRFAEQELDWPRIGQRLHTIVERVRRSAGDDHALRTAQGGDNADLVSPGR